MSIIIPIINGDLKPEKRSGHISVFYKKQFLVFGGYGDRNVTSDDYLVSNYLWCYNVETSQWTHYTTKGDHPGNTTGSCATLMGDKIYLFAGFHQKDLHTNQLYFLDLRKLTWYNFSEKVEGERPSPRDKFGCWKYKRNIIYFGGFGHPPLFSKTKGEFHFEEMPDGYTRGFGWNNQLYVLDCQETMTWSQPDCTGDIPSPRAAFSCAQIDGVAYLFGGRFQDSRLNDMYCLDLVTYDWKMIPTPEIAPCGRSWHVLMPVSDNYLFLYGGLDSQAVALKDVWIFDIRNSNWIQLENASNSLGCFSPRLWHTACATDSPGEVVVFGGCSNSVFASEHPVHTNVVFVFRFSPLPLRRLCFDSIMQNFEMYCTLIGSLPRSLQRNINYRCNALGLHGYTGHVKLANSCQIT